MTDGGRDPAQLEKQLAELTRRLAELETRLAEIEGRPAAAAGPGQQPWGQPWPAQQPWRQPWPAQQPWGLPQGWSPQQQRGGPPPRQPQPQQQPQGAAIPTQPQPQPATPATPPQPEYPRLAPRYPDASAQRPYRTAPPPPAQPRAARPAQSAPSQSLAEELGLSLVSLRDLESRLTGRLLAWVGAAAVVLGSVFFLSLAFSRGWLGPEGRVAMGIAGGAFFVGAGAWLFGRRQEQLGHVIVAVGLGVVSLSLFAGTRFYGLYSPEAALTGSFVAAIVAAAIAVRVKSEAVAIFGLLAIAAAHPQIGASPNSVTIAFLALTVVGTTAIALVKSWRWLPPIAFA